MAFITLAQFLNDPAIKKDLLLEIEDDRDFSALGFAGAEGTGTLRFCSHTKAFRSLPTDARPNLYFEPRIANSPIVSRQINEALTGNSTQITFGQVDIANGDRAYDYLPFENIENKPFTMYLGGPRYTDSFDEYLPVVVGRVDRVERTDTLIKIFLTDQERDLDREVRDEYITNLSGQEILMPKSFGICRNVKPPLIDPLNLTYKYNSGGLSSGNSFGVLGAGVRDNAVVVPFVPDNPNGEFDLTAPPAGTVTADIVGSFFLGQPGFASFTVGGIMRGILTEHAQGTYVIDPGVDTWPQPLPLFTRFVGYHAGDRTKTNILDIFDELVGTFGGYYYFDRAGVFRLGQLQVPELLAAGDVAFTLDANKDIVGRGRRRNPGAIRVRRVSDALWDVKFNYWRNFYPQRENEIAGGATIANQDFAPEKWRALTLNDSARKAIWQGAEDGEFNNYQFFVPGAEFARRQGFWTRPRYSFEFTTVAPAFQYELGDVIQVTNNPFEGFVSDFWQILNVQDSPLDGLVNLRCYA